MEKNFIDFSGEKKVSVIKEKARQAVIDDFQEFLSERYDKIRKIKSNEIGIVVGQALDLDGFPSDVVVVLKAEAKSWYDKDDCKRPVVRYDLDDEADAYEMELKAKKAPKK